MPKVEIRSLENGPNLVMIDGKAGPAFCRCGHSSHKPMCDGTHRKVGFQAPGATTVLLEQKARRTTPSVVSSVPLEGPLGRAHGPS
ncbi:MAG: CDGSH iron-sulfur domain-containing protein [Thermoplasmata archaeon]